MGRKLLKRQSDEARERIADVHADLCVQRWGVTAYLRRHETHTLKEAVEAHQRVVRIRNRTAICVSSR